MNLLKFFQKKDIGTSFAKLLPKKRTSNFADEKYLATCYRKWIYTCVSKNADALASQNLKLIAMDSPNNIKVTNIPIGKSRFNHDKSLIKSPTYMRTKEITQIVSHPFLELMEKPNSKDSQYTLMYSIATNLELFGTSYILVTKDTTLDIPVQLDVLHSQFVEPIMRNHELVGYKYGYGKNMEEYSVDEIIVIKYYSPYDDNKGYAPLQAVLTQYNLDNSFDEYALAVNDNSGNPGTIIKFQGQLNEDKRNFLEEQFNKTMKGIANTGRSKVIGGDFDIVNLGLTPRELDFMAGRRVTKEAIFGAFGVPLPFTDPQDTNRASFDTALLQYQMFTVTPKIRQIVNDLNSHLISMYDEPRIKLTYDDPVQQNRKDLIDEQIKLVEAGIISEEEARKVIME